MAACVALLGAYIINLLESGTLQAQTYTNVASEFGVTAIPGSINFGSGVSFYDFNNDGLDDLSIAMTNDSCRFFLNTGSGFVQLPSLVFANAEGKCLLWVDYDNDGDLDLFLTINNGRHMLLQNDGNFNFTDVSVEAGLWLGNELFYGASFGDYDRDGFLDLYVCVYTFAAGPEPGQSENRLYHNNGDGTFTDVSFEAGVNDGIALSFQSVWFDYDMDGWPDLLVINDRLYANSLYHNNGDGTFSNVAAAAGVAFAGQDPMTASIADFDNDGDLDIYLTNTGAGTKLPKLLINNGDGTFSEQAAAYQVQIPHWTWGATWFDMDNDGWQDLYVTTGNPSPLVQQVGNYAFRNQGSGSAFNNANMNFGGGNNAQSFSVARGDINNDGYYDLAVVNRIPINMELYLHEGAANNYIKLTLHGTASNSYGIGSWIRVYANGLVYTQYTHCGENYLSQNSQHHIFGLGSATLADSVSVTYTSGHTDTYYNLAAGNQYHLTEGDSYHVYITASPAAEICEGDSVLLHAGTHTGYLWSSGLSDAGIYVSQSGTYTVQVYNEYGVVAMDSIAVVVQPLPELAFIIQQVGCAQANDGSIEVINLGAGGTAQVEWAHGASGSSLDNLAPGTYSVIYTDLNGCSSSGEVAITEPDPIVINLFCAGRHR